MSEAKTNEFCHSHAATGAGCCQIEAVVGIDERGQMVLPKELREKAGIRPGDKLAVVSLQHGDQTCCLTLFRVEELAGMVQDFLGPVMSEIINTRQER